MNTSDREITIKAGPTFKWKDHPVQVVFTLGGLTKTFQRRVSSYKGFHRFLEFCHRKMWKGGFCP